MAKTIGPLAGFSYRGPMPEEPKWWKPGSKRKYEEAYNQLVALSYLAPASSLCKVTYEVPQTGVVAPATQTPPPSLHKEGSHWSTLTLPNRRTSLKAYIPVRIKRRAHAVNIQWDPRAWRQLGEQIDKYHDNPLLILQPVRNHLRERQWVRDSSLFL